MKMLSTQGHYDSVINAFNRESDIEIETIRDFIILHYNLNERTDSDFWRDMRDLTLPPRLAQKIELFRDSGAIFNDQYDIFLDASWLQVMLGQGVTPASYHPNIDGMSGTELTNILTQLRQAKQAPVAQMMSHQQFLKKYTGA
jgi:tryptophan halogenase